ncbi:uncharacterized protein LOC129601696 [Paramacrobiotus metropolitanus]|uniref:uncharacterized protein LOC129601696 n=1 Tax=Paramacrobiotus metropolitanus TaxID=2943436 RepID=UPI002445F82C|nr:uncharacterized protein LOC129601696 [Paramacrobiotus metropolitanus]
METQSEPLRAPENTEAYLPNLKTESREQYTNGYFLNWFTAFVQKGDNPGPHPLLSLSTQHHFGPERQTRDACVVVSPHRALQVAPMIQAWIHESKAGKVRVKDSTALTGYRMQDMLFYESKRQSIGAQLLGRLCNPDMVAQMHDYSWTELWGSSAVGPHCTVWQRDLTTGEIYRMISFNAAEPEKELLQELDDPDPIQFLAEFWNMQLEVDQELLEGIVGYGRGEIVAATNKLGDLTDELKLRLNVPLQNVADEEFEVMEVDESDDESGSDSTYTPSSPSSSDM